LKGMAVRSAVENPSHRAAAAAAK